MPTRANRIPSTHLGSVLDAPGHSTGSVSRVSPLHAGNTGYLSSTSGISFDSNTCGQEVNAGFKAPHFPGRAMHAPQSGWLDEWGPPQGRSSHRLVAAAARVGSVARRGRKQTGRKAVRSHRGEKTVSGHLFSCEKTQDFGGAATIRMARNAFSSSRSLSPLTMSCP